MANDALPYCHVGSFFAGFSTRETCNDNWMLAEEKWREYNHFQFSDWQMSQVNRERNMRNGQFSCTRQNFAVCKNIYSNEADKVIAKNNKTYKN